MLKMKFLWIILLITLAGVCVSCGNKNKGNTSNPTKDNGQDFYKEDIETFEIDNPICVLKYSLRWQAFVRTEVKTLSDGCSVTFHAMLEGKSIFLFSFIFCDVSEDGYLLGILQTKSGEKNVYLVDYFDAEQVAALSEEAATQYDEMCHDINVIISKLIYDNHMILVG